MYYSYECVFYSIHVILMQKVVPAAGYSWIWPERALLGTSADEGFQRQKSTFR